MALSAEDLINRGRLRGSQSGGFTAPRREPQPTPQQQAPASREKPSLFKMLGASSVFGPVGVYAASRPGSFWANLAGVGRKVGEEVTSGIRRSGEDIAGALEAEAITEAQTGQRAGVGLKPFLGPLGLLGEAAKVPIRREQVGAKQTREETVGKINEALSKTEGKEERAKLLKLRQQTENLEPDALETVETLSKSNKQIVGDFAELALDIATAGEAPGILRGVKGLARAGGSGAAIGAGFGGAVAAQEDKPFTDILTSGATGAAVGAGLGLGGRAAGRFFGRGGRAAGREAPEAVAREATEEVSERAPERLTREAADVSPISPVLRDKKPERVVPGGRVENPTQDVIEDINRATALRGEQEALYTEERLRRSAKLRDVKVEGYEGHLERLKILEGEMPKVDFDPLLSKVSEESREKLFKQIQESEGLRPLEQVTAAEGLAKLFGQRGGGVPTKSEIKLLRKVFGAESVEELSKNRPLFKRMAEVGVDAINVPRSLMSSFDLSAPFRQGVVLGAGNPREFGKAFTKMFKQAFSEKTFKEAQEEIQQRPTYGLMDEFGLALTDLGKLSKREESFMSNLAEKIPGIGKIVRGSGRGYTGFLNQMRADVFDKLYNQAKEIGVADDPKFLSSLTDYINTASGRGGLGKLEKAAPALNNVFFSPRLIASRVQMLNPGFYIKQHPLVRKNALKSLGTFTGAGLAVAGLAELAGAEVGKDPRSADFGKIKVGNTRFDPWGGFQQYMRLGAQLLTGQRVSSTTGEVEEIGEGFAADTRKDILYRFAESKSSPIASLLVNLLEEKPQYGEVDFSASKAVADRFIPMILQDARDVFEDEGPAGLIKEIPAAFGVGVQTYGGDAGYLTKVLSGEEDKDINDELVRLKVFKNAPKATFDYEGERKELKGDEKDKYRETVDETVANNLRELISSADYQKWDDEEKKKKINQTVKNSNKEAKEELFGDKKEEKKTDSKTLPWKKKSSSNKLPWE